jgi:hypothetical protein
MADKIDKLTETVEKLADVVQHEAGLNAQERKVNAEFREDVVAFQNETRDNFDSLSAKVDTNRLLLTRHETRTDTLEARVKRIEGHLGFDKDPN